MIATLALSLVGGWTYAGLLAEPSPTPKPPEAALVMQAKAPADPSKSPPADPSKSPPADAPKSPPVVARAQAQAPARPTRYRLADATGQAWEHADPAYLSSFVASRNASSAFYYAAPAYGAAACTTGRCR